MMLSFWADTIVALLLVATIGYSVVLNRRLGAVRADRDQFASVIRDLAAATQRAEGAVAGLRATADDLGRRVDKKIEEGRALRDDLAYMIERGGAIADKLEAQLRSGRDRLKPDATPAPRAAHPADGPTEHEIEPLPRPAQPLSYPGARARAPVAADPPRPAAAAESGNMASRAERELVRALSRRR
jgi:Domain of unknown function (DUF6468)